VFAYGKLTCMDHLVASSLLSPGEWVMASLTAAYVVVSFLMWLTIKHRGFSGLATNWAYDVWEKK
jgi:hypothetical protein